MKTTQSGPLEARDEIPMLNLQRQLSRVNLLIIDELGFVPPGHYQTPPSTSGPRCLGRRDWLERCWTGSPTSKSRLVGRGRGGSTGLRRTLRWTQEHGFVVYARYGVGSGGFDG